MKIKRSSTLPSVMEAVEAAREKKARQIVVLEMKEVADFTDYFLICSGTSNRQIQTISEEIERRLDTLPLYR